MKPAIANFTEDDGLLTGLYQGSPFDVDFQYTDDAGAGLSIAGYPNIEMRIRDMRGDGPAQVIASVANGRVVITNASLGMYTINIPQNVVATLSVGMYEYEVSLIDGSGSRWAMLGGQLQVLRKV